jgi:glycosyltransferase involved in cell wall biosynthesis
VRPAKWLLWFPIDQTPAPTQVLDRARRADYPAVYSEFGVTECAKAGLAVRYLPCGVNTAVYRPGDRPAARHKLGFPADAFVCAIVAANKGYPARKAFPEQLLAFARFQRRHPEALLYLHTAETASNNDGVNLEKMIAACEIPLTAVRFVDQYAYVLGLPESYLATVYQAADVLLGASYNEGFGIPLIEAQACGCPVITTNATSMPELTFNGICVDPVQPFWTWLDAWAAVPSVNGIEWALEQIAGWSSELRAEQATIGADIVQEAFNWDACVERHWAPLLAEIAEVDHG